MPFHYFKQLPAFPPLEHVVIATLSFLWAAQVTAGANGGDAQDRNPASGPPEVRTHDADRGVSMIDRLVMLQHQWTSEKAELKKIASANEEADISPEDFQAWLDAARHGEDAELRSRVLAHDHLLRNMEQIFQSLARSASATPASSGASPQEAPSQDLDLISSLTLSLRNLHQQKMESGETSQSFSVWVNNVLRTGEPDAALRIMLQIQRLQDSAEARRSLQQRGSGPSRPVDYEPKTSSEQEMKPLEVKHEEPSGSSDSLREQFEQDRQRWQSLQQNLQMARQEPTTRIEDLVLMEEQLHTAEVSLTNSFQEWVDHQRKYQQIFMNTVSETNGQN